MPSQNLLFRLTYHQPATSHTLLAAAFWVSVLAFAWILDSPFLNTRTLQDVYQFCAAQMLVICLFGQYFVTLSILKKVNILRKFYSLGLYQVYCA